MSLCILTNTAALFSPAANSGKFIRVMTLDVDEENNLRLPVLADFSRVYNELESDFKGILVLTASEALLPGDETAQLAAHSHGGTSKISVLNSLQIGPGMGILAQIAARKAAAGFALKDVEEYIRSIIPGMFTLIYPDRIPVFENGKSRRTHEATGGLPIFSLEEGQLSAYRKVRSQRHLLEILQEFLGEFEEPQHLAYFHGKNASLHTRPLREEANELFPGVHFHEIELNPTLTELFGEQTVGITVLEIPGENGVLLG